MQAAEHQRQGKAVVTHPSLKPMEARVSISRNQLLSELGELPRPSSELLSKHFRRRLASADTPGHYIPWIIADLLQVSTETSSFETLASGWFLLHEYMLFVDDLLDEPKLVDQKAAQIAGSLCLQRALGRLYQPVILSRDDIGAIDRYWSEAAEAIQLELDGSVPTTFEGLRLVSTMSLLKLWARLLLLSEDRRNDIDWAEEAVGALAAAIQLLDSIQDWEEDWSARRTSTLLQKVSLRSGTDDLVSPDLSRTQVLAGVVISGALGETLDEAAAFLRQVLVASRQNSAVLASEWAEGRLDQVLQLRSVTQTLRVDASSESFLTLAEIDALLETETFSAALKQLLDLISNGYLAD